MRTKKFIYLVIMILFFPAQSFGEIKAGVSQLEITPRIGLRMYGYSARKDTVSRGILDALYLRVLVLSSEERSIGFLVYDLGHNFSREIQDELRRDINEQTGIDEVIFIATHTHSGPRIKGGDRIENLQDWEKKICSKMITAVKTAFNSMKPVKIGFGLGDADYNYNRIKVHPDGRVEMIWRYRGNINLGHADPTVAVLKIDDLEGNTIAVLVNYACHPVVYGSDNFKYSADYPGALCAEVQKSMKGNPVCIFVTGAAGDMNPYCWNIQNKDKQAQVEEIGKGIASEVIRVANGIETKSYAGEQSILHEKKHFETTSRWDKEKEFKIPLSVVLITPEIGWIGLPGEIFVEFQEEIRRKSPVKFLFVSGYTNGNFGYFPTISAAVAGGYGADWSTNVEVGTGEHLVIESVVSLYKLLGKLKPKPSK